MYAYYDVCERACQYVCVCVCVCVRAFVCPHGGLDVKGSHSAARDLFRKSLFAVSSTLEA